VVRTHLQASLSLGGGRSTRSETLD
jgi:hypothetical protein